MFYCVLYTIGELYARLLRDVSPIAPIIDIYYPSDLFESTTTNNNNSTNITTNTLTAGITSSSIGSAANASFCCPTASYTSLNTAAASNSPTVPGSFSASALASASPSLSQHPAPALPDLSSYAGVAWTGCSLSITSEPLDPRVEFQLSLARKAFAAGVPQFGSCWALQVAAVAAGARCRPARKGREMGFGRSVTLTAAGARHGMYQGKKEIKEKSGDTATTAATPLPRTTTATITAKEGAADWSDGRKTVFDVYESHEDEVDPQSLSRLSTTSGPDHARVTVLAGNDWSPVQAAEVTVGRGTFWGVQYHPEYDLKELAMLVNARVDKLVKMGFFANRAGAEEYIRELMAVYEVADTTAPLAQAVRNELALSLVHHSPNHNNSNNNSNGGHINNNHGTLAAHDTAANANASASANAGGSGRNVSVSLEESERMARSERLRVVKHLLWKYGISEDVLDHSIRTAEVKNWVSKLVIPHYESINNNNNNNNISNVNKSTYTNSEGQNQSVKPRVFAGSATGTTSGRATESGRGSDGRDQQQLLQQQQAIKRTGY